MKTKHSQHFQGNTVTWTKDISRKIVRNTFRSQQQCLMMFLIIAILVSVVALVAKGEIGYSINFRMSTKNALRETMMTLKNTLTIEKVNYTTENFTEENQFQIFKDPMAPELQAKLQWHLKRATEKKIILIWHPMFTYIIHFKVNTSKCGNCDVTYDREKISDSATGAVVFHFHAISASSVPPPETRNRNQLYIFWGKESPVHLKAKRKTLDFEDQYGFNATMTYRRDSDFQMGYRVFQLEVIMMRNKHSINDLLKLKTKTAVAIVSNCRNTPGARTRLKYLNEIKQLGFELDAFGACFGGRDKFAGGADRLSNEFRNEIKKYKFYFAFENSFHCKEYISEKFFHNALGSYSVPVAWGGRKEDYAQIAPPGSYILLEDFSSIKKLVEYLDYLDRNDTAYLEYFKWLTLKPSKMPGYGRTEDFCAICRALHGINIDDMYNPNFNYTNPTRPLFTKGVSGRRVPSLKDWFYGEESPECLKS